MAGKVTLRAVGLYRSGSDMAAPDGALSTADNVVLSRDNIIESRRGLDVISTKALTRLFGWRGLLVGWGANKLTRSTDGAAWTDYAETVEVPSGALVRVADQNGNLYVLASDGVKRLDAVAGSLVAAGIPPAGDPSATLLTAAGTAVEQDGQVAYRILYGQRDANDNLHLGPPSGPAIITNPAASGPHDVDLFIPLPPVADPQNFFVQIYRTAKSVSAATSPGDEMQLVYETACGPNVDVAITNAARATNVTTLTTAVAHGLWVGDLVALSPFDAVNYPLSLVRVASTPTTTSFTYSDPGGDAGSAPVDGRAYRVGFFIMDTAPDALRQSALYTNETQEGALAANYAPPIARDVAAFRGALIYANVTTPPRVSLRLVAVGGATGLVAGDIVTVNGWNVTAVDADEGASTFLLHTADDAATNLRETTRALVRAINRLERAEGFNAIAHYASGADDFPGAFVIEGLPGATSVTVEPSRTTAFTGVLTASAKTQANGYVISKFQQPESIPAAQALVPEQIGSAYRKIARVVATRDCVFFLKEEDGVFKLTGQTPDQFVIDPFDPNTHIVAPETAYPLDNKVFALTESGVVACTDTGVELVSRQPGGSSIEDDLLPLLAPAMRSLTTSLAFAIGVESDRKYLLFLPTYPTDTACTQVFVYDLLTRGWSRWPFTALHGVSNGADDRLYFVGPEGVHRERKDFEDSDHYDDGIPLVINEAVGNYLGVIDSTGVGVGDLLIQGDVEALITAVGDGALWTAEIRPFTVGDALAMKAIPQTIEWAPQFSPPGMLHHFRECVLSFKRAAWHEATIAFATDLDPSFETVDLAELDATDYATIRVLVPRNKARGSLLKVRFDTRQAAKPCRIQAMTVIYEPGKSPIILPRPGITGQPSSPTDSDALDQPIDAPLVGP